MTNEDITMGNDEFILYIRKTRIESSMTNDALGKEIATWIKNNSQSFSQVKDVPCLWGDSAKSRGVSGIPTTATQFTFDRKILPKLYDFLDDLAKK